VGKGDLSDVTRELGSDAALDRLSTAMRANANGALKQDVSVIREETSTNTTNTTAGEELSQALLEQRYKAQDDDEFPDPMGEGAFYGPVGRIVQAVEPLTEASKEVLLLQLLVAFGCLIGRSPWVNAGGKHYTNEFLLIVGRTGRKGRKGTGNTIIDNICCQLDEDWFKLQMSGTQSGEGIIHQIRDEKWGPAKGKKGKNADPEDRPLELIDEGVTDKRKMVIEEEFSQILAVAGRENSTVTETIRQAWDSKPRLQNSSKHNGAVVTNPHVSLVGHITPNEFRTKTAKTNDATNGTLNRFLFCASKRSKILPDAPYIDWTDPGFARLLKPLKDGYENLSLKTRAREMRITRDPEAQECWDRFYRRMASQEYSGPLDEAMARAEQHVARLSEIFAIADNSYIILKAHQLAAEAVWDYCERSARWAFGILTGDPRADKVIRALKRSPKGLTRTEISSQVFSRNMTKTDLEDILTAVKKSGLADWTIECDAVGNPQVERWRAK
jgi:hypothetical protein